MNLSGSGKYPNSHVFSVLGLPRKALSPNYQSQVLERMRCTVLSFPIHLWKLNWLKLLYLKNMWKWYMLTSYFYESCLVIASVFHFYVWISWQALYRIKHTIVKYIVDDCKVPGKDGTQMINGKKICWNYRKGRCRFGHNCKYAHDSDIQKTQEEIDGEKEKKAGFAKLTLTTKLI